MSIGPRYPKRTLFVLVPLMKNKNNNKFLFLWLLLDKNLGILCPMSQRSRGITWQDGRTDRREQSTEKKTFRKPAFLFQIYSWIKRASRCFGHTIVRPRKIKLTSQTKMPFLRENLTKLILYNFYNVDPVTQFMNTISGVFLDTPCIYINIYIYIYIYTEARDLALAKAEHWGVLNLLLWTVLL